MTKLTSKHEEEIQALKENAKKMSETYTQRTKALEDKLRTSQESAILSLKSSHEFTMNEVKAKYEQELSSTQDDLKSTKTALATASSRFEGMRVKLIEKHSVDIIEAVKNNAKTIESKHSATMRELRDALQSDMESLKKQHSASQAEVEATYEANLRSRTKAMQHEIDRQSIQISNKDAQLKVHLEHIRELTGEVESLKTTMMEAEAKHREIVSSLEKDREQKVLALKDELGCQSAEGSEKDAQLKTHVKRIRELTGEVESLKTAMMEAEAKHGEIVSSLEKDHEQQISTLDIRHKKEMASNTSTFANTIRESKDEHAREIDALGADVRRALDEKVSG